MSRKVLICSHPTNYADDKTINCRMACEGWLERMGYEHDYVAMEPGSTYGATFADTSHGYEFIIWIRITSGFVPASNAATMLDGSAVIPTFIIMALDDSSSTAEQVVGVDRLYTYSGHYKWVTHKAGFEYPSGTGEWQQSDSSPTNWTPITTIQKPSAQAGSGKVNFNLAKRTGTQTTIYFDGGSAVGYNLPMLMQEAIDDGVISAPTYKLMGTIDVDDIPNAQMVMSDMVALYDLQVKYNIPISWGVHAGALEEADDSLYNFIGARQVSAGGLIYPIEHYGNVYWSETASDIDTWYKQHILNMAAKGMYQGDDDRYLNSYGYHYFNINAFNDYGAQICEKYGIKVVRLTNGIKGAADNNQTVWVGSPGVTNKFTGYHRGMMVVPGVNSIASTDLKLDKYADVDEFALQVSYDFAIRGLAYSCVPYLHGTNFQYGHSDSDGNGRIVIESMGVMGQHMKDVMEFVHPSRLYELYTRDSVFDLTQTPGITSEINKMV